MMMTSVLPLQRRLPIVAGPMRSPVSRRMLQVSVAIAALVPVIAGTWGVLTGLNAASPSHERYLSGVLVAIGIGFWSTVQHIEDKTRLFRQLALLVIAGGLCRLLGVALGDGVGWSVSGPLIMELVVTPLLLVWQSRLATGRLFPFAALPPKRFRGSVDASLVGDLRRPASIVVDLLETSVAKVLCLLCWGAPGSPATHASPDRRRKPRRSFAEPPLY
jgi:Domain of unknown function (DUF4345)